jgi:drug/metabolite transporter (DMT)-like permease
MFLIATAGGVIALLSWGLSDYFAGKSGQNKDECLTVFILQIITPIFLLPIILWRGFQFELDISLIFVIVLTIFFTIAYISFVKALSIGPFGVVAPLGNSYALVTLIIGIIFLQFQASLLQLLALLGIILGVFLLSYEKGFDRKKIKGSAVYLAMITMIFWGLGFAFVEMVIDVYSWDQLLFLIGLFMSFFTFLYYLFVHKKFPRWKAMSYKRMRLAWHGGVLLAIGGIAFYLASEFTGSVIIPAVIASASPLVTSLAAHFYDKERISLLKRVGAVIIVIALIILNI